MKPGIPLSQMLAEVKRQSEAKVDYLVATPRLRLEPFGSGIYLHLYDESGSEPIEPLSISPIAHRQIGTHLKVPAAYYDRMLKEAPELLAQNLNCWFTKEPAQRMLRTLDGTARAYLSNRYRRIDNLDIARVVLPILGGACPKRLSKAAKSPTAGCTLRSWTHTCRWKWYPETSSRPVL